MDIGRGEIIRRLLVWLGLMLVSFILLAVAFSIALGSGLEGQSTPRSAIELLWLAAVAYLLSLVPLFHRTPVRLKVFGAICLLVGSAWFFSAVW